MVIEPSIDDGAWILQPLASDPELLECALDGLPKEQRDVFIAHEIEGLSFADMSTQWRVPQNTLLARKRYAVLALRARLQAEYGDLTL